MVKHRAEDWDNPRYADLRQQSEALEAKWEAERVAKAGPQVGQLHPTRASYEYARVGDFAQGDAFLDEASGTAYIAQSGALSQSENHLTVFARPRKGHVASEVISRMQFGTPGITTEDTDEQVFRFGVNDVIPRRR